MDAEALRQVYRALGLVLDTSGAVLALPPSEDGLVPLRFSPGALATAVADGALEYDGTDLWFTVGTLRARVQVGAGGAGVLILSTVQRLALTPSIGQQVYDTDVRRLLFFDGYSWSEQ